MMSDLSKIAWTDSTFNPWMGCTKVSQGCKHCYAETLMDHRYGKVKWGPQGERLKTSAAYWKKPLLWNKERFVECDACGWRGHMREKWNLCKMPGCDGHLNGTRRRVFCGSLCDVFEDNPQVANWRGELFQLIEQTPNLDWLLLTKRPEKIFSLGTDAVGEVFDNWMARQKNVWLGTSVESQAEFAERVKELVSVFAWTHFLSVEPLMGPIEIRFTDCPVDWVIVGGESGADCREMDVTWARDIMKYCKQYGIAFFMKQLGGHPDKQDRLDAFPEDLRVREFPNVKSFDCGGYASAQDGERRTCF
jgi:protein gp37